MNIHPIASCFPVQNIRPGILLLLCMAQLQLSAQVPPPVADYPLDQVNLVRDVSGNANGGSPIGATLSTNRNGDPLEAYEFDGVNDLLIMKSTSNFQPGFPISIAAWVEPGTGSDHPIFANDQAYLQSAGPQFGAWLEIVGNRLQINFGDGTFAVRRFTGTTAIPNNDWVHVAGVIEGPNEMSLYINGVRECGNYSGTATQIAYQNTLGAAGHSHTGDYLNGKLDEILLFDVALTSADLGVIIGQNLGLDLVAHYPFDGNVNADDQSGNNNHGTPVGATLAPDRLGNPNEAYDFNPLNNAVINYANTSPDFHPQLPVTIAGFVRADANGLNCIFNNNHVVGIYRGIWMSINNSALAVSVGDGGFPGPASRFSATSFSPVPLGTWIHVAAVVHGPNDIELFLNGVEDCVIYTGTGTTLAYDNNDGISGVNRLVNQTFFDGSLDEFRFYNRALTAEEISILAEELICVPITICVPPPSPPPFGGGNGHNDAIIDGLFSLHAQVYPNPATQVASIRIDSPIDPATEVEITVIDVLGKVVAKGQFQASESYELGLTEMSPGTYLLQLDTPQGQLTERLVVK